VETKCCVHLHTWRERDQNSAEKELHKSRGPPHGNFTYKSQENLLGLNPDRAIGSSFHHRTNCCGPRFSPRPAPLFLV